MQEYWVNVYKYPKLKEYQYSHLINSRSVAKVYQYEYDRTHRKVLYRIHVKMKSVKPKYEEVVFKVGVCIQTIKAKHLPIHEKWLEL